MELSEVISKRRSIRKYKPDPIPEDKLRMLFEALQAAPTAYNRQPFEFIFVKDAGLREKLVRQACHQDYLLQPPILMVACCQKGNAFNVAIAVDHMILRATELGLGTCWVEWFERDAARRILNIPEDKEIPILVPIGYPDENPPARPRKPIDQIVTVI